MTFLTSSVDCPSCGSQHKGKPFCTYENGVHCFSCGYTRSYDHGFTIQNGRDVNPMRAEFPDCITDPAKFSLVNLKWLTKYYVDETLIRKFRISETRNGGLIFPYYKDEVLVCSQTRWNTEPRMIISHGAKVPALFAIRESRTLVIVEDFISAIRGAEHCHSVCLWGTKVSYDYLKLWFKQYDTILVWLDNDHTKQTNSGQIAANKICNMLNDILQSNNRRYGFGCVQEKTTRRVVTDCDLKAYSPSELRSILNG